MASGAKMTPRVGQFYWPQVVQFNWPLTIELKDGEFLFHQGDPENSFYIVARGRLALVKERKKTGSLVFCMCWKREILLVS